MLCQSVDTEAELVGRGTGKQGHRGASSWQRAGNVALSLSLSADAPCALCLLFFPPSFLVYLPHPLFWPLPFSFFFLSASMCLLDSAPLPRPLEILLWGGGQGWLGGERGVLVLLSSGVRRGLLRACWPAWGGHGGSWGCMGLAAAGRTRPRLRSRPTGWRRPCVSARAFVCPHLRGQGSPSSASLEVRAEAQAGSGEPGGSATETAYPLWPAFLHQLRLWRGRARLGSRACLLACPGLPRGSACCLLGRTPLQGLICLE